MRSKDIKIGDELIHTWYNGAEPRRLKILEIAETGTYRFKVQYMGEDGRSAVLDSVCARDLHPLNRWEEMSREYSGGSVVLELGKKLEAMGFGRDKPRGFRQGYFHGRPTIEMDWELAEYLMAAVETQEQAVPPSALDDLLA